MGDGGAECDRGTSRRESRSRRGGDRGGAEDSSADACGRSPKETAGTSASSPAGSRESGADSDGQPGLGEADHCRRILVRDCDSLGNKPNNKEVHKVKVWFQNRRTKQKKDQSRDLEKRASSSASKAFATPDILRLLEQGRLLSPPSAPSLLTLTPGPPRLPASHRGASLGDPRNSSPHLTPLTSASASPPLPPHPPALCFCTAPLLDLPAGYELGSSAFEPYSRLDGRVGSPGGGKKASA
ncbi:hypothetical protein EI555_016657 [Monodon monoceros]|uniref:Homeobox domain-containing protein n=1 Tax=Monodon monoceros TaxID=40151 RepID=A0A4U1EKG8_MONMO|nr:hypothetical protein EI555_016657 [Monodon monoceros]